MSPTIPNLLILALALGELTGKPLTLMDLFGEAAEFDLPLTPSGPVPRAWLQGVLTGKPVKTTDSVVRYPDNPQHAHTFDGDDPVTSPLLDSEAARLNNQLDLAKKAGIDLAPEEVKTLEDQYFDQMLDEYQQPPERFLAPDRLPATPRKKQATLAEERAAKKLGISPQKLQRLAFDLWGRSLEFESAARAGEGSSPQARGNYTRQLLAEISQHLNQKTNRD